MPEREIEERIRSYEASLADITSDDPNVWYELGYALAAGKVVVLVATEGQEDVAAQLRGALKRRAAMVDAAVQPFAAPLAGLNPQQLAALMSIAQSQDEAVGLSGHQVRREMGNVGFTDIATGGAIPPRAASFAGQTGGLLAEPIHREPEGSVRVSSRGVAEVNSSDGVSRDDPNSVLVRELDWVSEEPRLRPEHSRVARYA